MDLDWHAVAQTTYDKDGFFGIQTDVYGEEESGSSPYEGHHLHGFVSRPLSAKLDPGTHEVDAANAAQALVMKVGGVRGAAFVLEDPRILPLLPTLQEGETMMYGAQWGQFVRCHADGSISLVTTSKPASDGTGQPLHLWIRPTGLEFVAQWGRLIFDQTGFHVKHVSGARFDLGSIGGMPSPLSAIGSYVAMQAGMVMANASAVSAGSSQGTQQAVALAAPVLAHLTLVQTALTAIQAALASAVPASAQTAAVQAAVTAATADLTAVTTTMPSPSLVG